MRKQEENNRELSSELQKLDTIREGMAAFAVKQESDYKLCVFVGFVRVFYVLKVPVTSC